MEKYVPKLAENIWHATRALVELAKSSCAPAEIIFNDLRIVANPDSDPDQIAAEYLKPKVYTPPKLTTFGKVADPPTDDSFAILTLLELADFHLAATEKTLQSTTEERLAIEARKRALQAAKDWLKKQLPL